MKLLIFDFNTLRKEINKDNYPTKVFEIYYDIGRMLEADISKEACFKLYTKYSENYGKLRDYINILSQNPNKQKFDEEFYRRYKHLYLNYSAPELIEIKNIITKNLQKLRKNYVLGLISITNTSFTANTLKFLELTNYFNFIRADEYLNNYTLHLKEVLSECAKSGITPEEIILLNSNQELKETIENDEFLNKFNIQFSTIEQIL